MKKRKKIMRAVKFTGATILIIGIAIFLYGFFIHKGSSFTGIGIGTVMGAVFIFIMGIFFVATEETLKERFVKLKTKIKRPKK
ncbi:MULTISPECIES: hypothetical protein [Virgibacillus]|uniref:Uncharacterized protein n=2 Tax=Virgibacillus TaxID=84406 RepID=A0A024QFJ3_9BACI|nr:MULTISPECIES: hypothetical protein [Virgibacillus]EQB37127.1 hypothetical protein M948_09600 [Virgibacillus sp. CM-4]GGJ72047.1 hypothetical protein GCM10007111_37000 [Virgibacillus kapii]CDQ41279.1 hypothetical protein BN990_03640 [Virgibacillus massiliensis]